MSRDELVERFTLDRVGASPAVFDFQKLEWLNGVYLRELPVDEYADRLVTYLRGQGLDWDEERVRRSAPLVQEKIATLGEYPEFAGFLFRDVEPDPALLDGVVLEEADSALAAAEPFTAETIESRLRELAERLELKPREAFQPIRVAVTGSKVSPGLFESIELLGKEQTLERLRRASAGSGLGGASGSSARWNSRQARRRKREVGPSRSTHRRSRSAIRPIGSSFPTRSRITADRPFLGTRESHKYPQRAHFFAA